MPQPLLNEPRPTHRVQELARAIRLHPITVYRLIADGEIRAVRIGHAIRIPDSEFRRLTGDEAA